MPHSLSFAIVALIPAGLVALGALLGGSWAWAGLLYMTVIAWAFDKLVPARGGASQASEAAAERVTLALGVVHFALLALTVRALAAGGLGVAAWTGLFLGAGLYVGQVSNAAAHELIHRTDRGLFRLGKWIYISLLYGHHTSAHLKVHHRFAATAEDPNTARPGESFYAFAPRAWRDGFRKGYAMERADVRRRGTGGATPYVSYVLGALGFLALSWLTFGWAGLGTYVALAAYAQLQLLLSDYVQHYGLSRAVGADGRPEPVARAHSWNAAGWFTAHLMLNGPRHSDHHVHPARPYPELTLTADAPRLPASLPVMSVLALYPRGWRRVMDRALAGQGSGDPAELQIAEVAA
ncbi:MAG: alkane 1-monooxygenase [Maritimibacter sp.]|nr:alkane 1-monooxygenase [Maritimibacter sp.]